MRELDSERPAPMLGDPYRYKYVCRKCDTKWRDEVNPSVCWSCNEPSGSKVYYESSN